LPKPSNPPALFCQHGPCQGSIERDRRTTGLSIRRIRAFDARMADNRTISQLEAEGYPWIGCECCKGTVWVPFKMLRERIPMLSAMTLDQLGAKMKCDRCSKRPERYAMQFVLTSLLQRIGEGNPSMRTAYSASPRRGRKPRREHSIVRGAKAGHLPETLRIIEQMRLMLVGKGKLKRDQ